MTTEAIELIKRMEGLRLNAYKPVPTEKYYTIGYGHYGADVAKDMVIDEDTAERMLMNDLEVYIFNVKKALQSYATVNEYQFGALVSFCFNVGVGNFLKSTLLKKVRKDPNDPTIADEFNKWVYAGGKKLMGLVQRRQLEATLYFKKTDIDAGYHCNLK